MAYKTARYIFTVLFLGMLFAFSSWNAYKEYPPVKAALSNDAPVNPESLRKTISAVDSAITENIQWRTEFIETYAYLQVLLGKEESGNFDRVKDKNGHWYFVDFYPQPQNLVITENYARRINALRNYVEPLGAKVLYVAPPTSHIENFTQFSAGIPAVNFASPQDALLYNLHSYGIDYIDLRTSLRDHDIPYENWFFKTDHHWTSELAFAAFTDIISYMDEKYNANLDTYDYYKNPENYGTITYPQSFLGSFGRRAGITHSGLDDFTVIFPKFDGNYKVSNDDGKYHDESIIGSVYYTSQLDVSDIYTSAMYSYYLQGIKAKKIIENKQYPNGPKLLVIGDSYFLPIAAFMAPLFGQISYIWPLAESGNIDIEEFVKDNIFDYVVIESYEGNLSTDDMFDFFRSADKTEADIIKETNDDN